MWSGLGTENARRNEPGDLTIQTETLFELGRLFRTGQNSSHAFLYMYRRSSYKYTYMCKENGRFLGRSVCERTIEKKSKPRDRGRPIFQVTGMCSIFNFRFPIEYATMPKNKVILATPQFLFHASISSFAKASPSNREALAHREPSHQKSSPY